MSNAKDPMTKVYILWVKADDPKEEKELEATLSDLPVIKEWKKLLPLNHYGNYDRK